MKPFFSSFLRISVIVGCALWLTSSSSSLADLAAAFGFQAVQRTQRAELGAGHVLFPQHGVHLAPEGAVDHRKFHADRHVRLFHGSLLKKYVACDIF